MNWKATLQPDAFLSPNEKKLVAAIEILKIIIFLCLEFYNELKFKNILLLLLLIVIIEVLFTCD